VLGWRYARARLTWTDVRFDLTGELLEKMLGHRTRLVQEPPSAWHRREDQTLGEYQGRSRTLDAWATALWSGVPSGWLALGMLTLAPVWLYARPEETRLALGIWGVLLGFRAFGRLSSGLAHLVGAAIALRRCRELLRSAAAAEPQPLTAAMPTLSPAATALQACDLTAGHGRRGPPVLRGLSLRLQAGQRLLLQGASGSGKSTLAAALTGLGPIDSGQLLLGGLDMAALGSQRWRRLIASAPQFHENHLFSQTLAFNLLIGRAWPPAPEDLKEAEQLCEELGLGPLLQRMPSGLFQPVGETGWQLSHGERSRVYIARTLLQRSHVVVLDESFAALDPATLSQALACELRRAPTLVVIAHP
jgi:ATP-binding cassette subfamily B protein